LSSEPTLADDDVQVWAKLDAPAYSYLISLQPDGAVKRCYPPTETQPPEPLADIHYPPEALKFFPLTDGLGLQAFVLIASRRPLPAYEKWKGKDGMRQRWESVRADQVWSYDGREFKPILRLSRGEPRERPGPKVPAPLQAVCEYLKQLPEVDVVQALAFPVQPEK
jgi:hypothetical protein